MITWHNCGQPRRKSLLASPGPGPGSGPGPGPVNVFITIFISHQKSIAHTKRSRRKAMDRLTGCVSDRAQYGLTPAPPPPLRLCPWQREAFKLRLLTFLTACCGASRCAVDVAEKANKLNVLRIIIFAVRRTRINISTVASRSPSHCSHCAHSTLKAVSDVAGRGVAGGSYSGAWLIIKCMWFILECASLTLAPQSRRQNQADKLLH